jgi:hypothetical protein
MWRHESGARDPVKSSASNHDVAGIEHKTKKLSGLSKESDTARLHTMPGVDQ